MTRNPWTLSAIPLLFAACTSTDSTLVETSEIYADLAAIAEDDGRTYIEATLHVGGPLSLEYVDLEGGDVLWAVLSSGATDVTELMEENHDLGVPYYTADFGTNAEDTEFRVEFDRETKTSALNSTVTLPYPLVLGFGYVDGIPEEVFAYSEPYSFSRSDTTTEKVVFWDPYEAPYLASGDQLSYEATGNCIQTAAGGINWTVDDVVRLSHNELNDATGNPGATCPITFTLTLTRQGTVDSAFGGGAFVATQTRTITLQSTP